MAIITSTNKKIVSYPFLHDPNDEKYYTFVYRPKTRANNTEYLLDDVVIPTSPNGCYYICVNPGVSAGSEPTFSTKVGGKTIDGTITWQARAYDLLLNSGDSITNSTFEATAGVTLANSGQNAGVTTVKVTDIGTLTEFNLKNTVTVTRVDGKAEIFERSIDVTVGDL